MAPCVGPVAFAWETVTPITRAFRRMTRAMEFDLCEMALTTHAQARAYGKDLPRCRSCCMHGLHHAALICPARLAAARAGRSGRQTRGCTCWSQTTGVWLRGVLRDEYGVAPDAMTWVTEEDAHVQEFADPPFVQRIAPDQDLRTMLLSGEIDAAVALAGLDAAQTRTVIGDADAVAVAWSRATGVHPINHVVVVKDALLAEHRWLADELMRLFIASREPVAGAPAYGIEANRPAIDLLMRYAAEQGLIPHPYRVDDLFVS